MYILNIDFYGDLKEYKIIMILEFHALNKHRADRIGTGIAVIIQYESYDKKGMIYELISIDDRNVFVSAHEFDGVEYVFNTIPKYPEGVALTFKFTKYKEIEINKEIECLINAYNIIQKMNKADQNKFEIWDSMNEGEFKKWKRDNEVRSV